MKKQAVILEKPTGNLSYAEMIRQVKKTVNEGNITCEINTRRAKSGNVILETANKEQADSVAELLKIRLGETMGIRRPSPTVLIFLMGIKESVEENELRGALEVFDEELKSIRNVVIRETRSGLRTAQYKNKTQENGWYKDSSGKAAVAVINEDLPILAAGSTNDNGFRWVEVRDLRIYACYWSPNKDTESFQRFLDCLEASVRSSMLPVIIAGDFNAKSGEWGDHREDAMGSLLTDLMSFLNFQACNYGNIPTFERIYRDGRVSQSHIDVTMASEPIARRVKGWKVLDEYTESLHRYITFTINAIADGPNNEDINEQERKWSWRKYGRNKLQKFLREKEFPLINDNALVATHRLDNYIKQACDASMPNCIYKGKKQPAYWWSETIAKFKEECHAARKKIKRNRQRNQLTHQTENLQTYTEARTKLKREILRSKKACWERLCQQVETDPWGLPYKIVSKKLIGRRPIPGITLPGRLDSIVEGLFPDQGPFLDFPKITRLEIIKCAKRIPSGKAPGPDGVPDFVIKKIATPIDQKFYARYLINKIAKLVLLQKGEKPLEQPFAYRPLCLLNTVEKFFERIIKVRIEENLIGETELSERQFGFRKGRSTTDALEAVMGVVNKAASGPLRKRELCTVVTLDVANAFNTARSDEIKKAVSRKGMPDYLIGIIGSYLNERSLIYGDNRSRFVTCGVPQGSVFGPLLWNIMYDDLFRIELGGHYPHKFSAALVGFADDVAVVTTGRNSEILELVTNEALDAVVEWLEDTGLTLSINKTEAMILASKMEYSQPVFRIKGAVVQIKEKVKYLGVELCNVLGFGKHVQVAATKASVATSAVARIMLNVRRASQQKRKLLANVVNSRLLYAAPAALVVAGLVPAHIMVMERTRRYKEGISDKETREESYRKWQHEWDNAEEGRWTKRLIPDIEKWAKRKHGRCSYHLTQMLTGHGCFGKYLYRFKRRAEPVCVDCGDAEYDAEHTLFRYDRWWRQRRELEMFIEAEMEPDSIVGVMLESGDKWEAVKQFITVEISTKEKEERRMQRAENQLTN
ncbi:hypothetical protein QTP88_020934 [Uroleucon formosanum]